MNSSAMMSPTMRTRRRPKSLMSASRRSLSDMTEDPADGGEEISDDRVGGESGPRPRLLGGSVSGADEHAASAEGARQLHVQPAVADGERPGPSDTEPGDPAGDPPPPRR